MASVFTRAWDRIKDMVVDVSEYSDMVPEKLDTLICKKVLTFRGMGGII